MLQQGGYDIKVLNTIDFKQSMKYNPFRYIRNENDILKLVNCIMENTKGEDSKGGEDFWVKAEALYYQALIAYIFYEAPEEEKNMTTLLEMLNASEVREEDETYKNAVDLMFDRLKERNPEHFAVRQYLKYKMAAGKTAKSILVSCGARMAPFDIKEVREMMEDDELELDKLGDKKTALFCVVSDVDTTFNFIAAMVYTQMFNVLCDKALENGGALKHHVTCLLDEFANQKIPNFQHLISVIRSREISAHIVVQTQSQLKAMYKDHAETIIGNCSCVLFLGGKERSTLKEISETLGKETIDLANTSDTRGSQQSLGINYQKTGKELMFVCSGGQGSDEPISESACMKRYLLLKGIREHLILEENRSTDTRENMQFSRERIMEVNPDGKIAFSTTNYHVFRSGIWARRAKMRALGVGAKTKWYFWPNAWVREFIGLMTEHRGKQILVLGGMILFYIIMVLLYYFVFAV